MENIKETIAKDLLKIKAVFFSPEQPFTWASGTKARCIAIIGLRLLRQR